MTLGVTTDVIIGHTVTITCGTDPAVSFDVMDGTDGADGTGGGGSGSDGASCAATVTTLYETDDTGAATDVVIGHRVTIKCGIDPATSFDIMDCAECEDGDPGVSCTASTTSIAATDVTPGRNSSQYQVRLKDHKLRHLGRFGMATMVLTVQRQTCWSFMHSIDHDYSSDRCCTSRYTGQYQGGTKTTTFDVHDGADGDDGTGGGGSGSDGASCAATVTTLYETNDAGVKTDVVSGHRVTIKCGTDPASSFGHYELL